MNSFWLTLTEYHTVREGSINRSLGNYHRFNLQGWLFKWTNYIKGYQKRLKMIH